MGLTGLGEKLIESKHWLWGAFVASLLESTIIPIPLELILIPVMVKSRKKAFALATATLVGCLIGAGLLYLLGAVLWDAGGERFAATVGLAEEAVRYRDKVQDKGFWLVFAGGLTPTPFQVVTIAAGLARQSLLTFIAACVASRGIRYFGLAALVVIVGERAERWYDKHKWLFAAGTIALLVVLYFATKGVQSLLGA